MGLGTDGMVNTAYTIRLMRKACDKRTCRDAIAVEGREVELP